MKITKKEIRKNTVTIERSKFGQAGKYQITVNGILYNNYLSSAHSPIICSYPVDDFDVPYTTYIHSKVNNFPGVIASAYTKEEFVLRMYRILNTNLYQKKN